MEAGHGRKTLQKVVIFPEMWQDPHKIINFDRFVLPLWALIEQ